MQFIKKWQTVGPKLVAMLQLENIRKSGLQPGTKGESWIWTQLVFANFSSYMYTDQQKFFYLYSFSLIINGILFLFWWGRRGWLLFCPVCILKKFICFAKQSVIKKLPKFSQVSPKFKDTVKKIWRPTSFCEATKVFVP